MSLDELGDEIGWDLAASIEDPEELADLPIFGLRWVANAVGVDWAATLGNARVDSPDAPGRNAE